MKKLGIFILLALAAGGGVLINHEYRHPTSMGIDSLPIAQGPTLAAIVRPDGCTAAPGWPLMTNQQFNAPIAPRGKRDSTGWIEETGGTPGYFPMAYANGIMTGTWVKGLKGGTGPFNVGFKRQNVHDMYSCIRVKLDSTMTIPNNGLKQFFWHGQPGVENINHVGQFRKFPNIAGQFRKQTGPDGFLYTTTTYCAVKGTAGTLQDKSVYTVRPTFATELRDSKFHTMEYTIIGGTVGHADGAITMRLDGVILCQATAVRWYAPGMVGTMFGHNFNPNSSGGGTSSGPVVCPRPTDPVTGQPIAGNTSWCTTEKVYYDFVYAEGR